MREILAPVDLLESGRLNPGAVGWSRRPLHNCNLAGRWPRKKRWDYWCFTSDRFLFSATISDLDYALAAFVYFLEYESGWFAEQTVVSPLPTTFSMPATPLGTLEFKRGPIAMRFDSAETGVELAIDSTDFKGGALSARIKVERPAGHDTLNVVVPWSERLFQFTSKQPCLPVEGEVRVHGRPYRLEKGTSFATLDYGRGIWPYSTTWNWASFSAAVGSDVVGVNLGAKWTDGTGMNENGLFLNGRLHKMKSDVEFTYDPAHFKKPWRLRSKQSDEVDLEFHPFFERIAKSELLVLRARVHQLIGRFSGRLRFQERRLEVRDVVGWAEEHVARW